MSSTRLRTHSRRAPSTAPTPPSPSRRTPEYRNRAVASGATARLTCRANTLPQVSMLSRIEPWFQRAPCASTFCNAHGFSSQLLRRFTLKAPFSCAAFSWPIIVFFFSVTLAEFVPFRETPNHRVTHPVRRSDRASAVCAAAATRLAY